MIAFFFKAYIYIYHYGVYIIYNCEYTNDIQNISMANDSLERNTASSWTEPVSIESSGSKEEYLETM